MARPKVVPKPPNGFVASAVGLPTADRNVAGRRQSWQEQAWRYWQNVGELRYPTTWIGNVMGRARLVAARNVDGDLIPVEPDHPAAVAMGELYGGPQGQSLMLQAFGTNLSVAGEAYLTYAENEWYVLSSGKATQQGKGKNRSEAKVRIDLGKEGGFRDLRDGEFVLRIWNPNPRNPQDADSPVRANLETLKQITQYDAHIAAQLKSRLTGGGLLLLPSEIDFGLPEDEDPGASQAYRFMKMLGRAMTTPVANQSDPSAVVPVVAMVPGEHLDKAHLITFWTDLDDKAVEMRDAAIKRLALGIDVPPEVLLGIADANHWNAWLSEESAIKAHLEPRLAIVTAGLTTGYLRHAIADEVNDVDEYYVIADTAQIRLRPNRSQEAMELYDRGLLRQLATLRETGFQDEDLMNEDERRNWMLAKIAIAASSPEQSLAALKALGIDLDVDPAAGEAGRAPADDMRTDTVPQLPRRDIPTREEAERRQEEALVAAATTLMFRALERAGNRLRTLHPRTDTFAMQAHNVYMTLSGDPDDLLRGSWDLAPELLGPYCKDHSDLESVVDVLDFYTRGVLASRKPPNQRTLRIQLAGRVPLATLGGT